MNWKFFPVVQNLITKLLKMFSQNITEWLKRKSLEIMPENLVQFQSKLLLKLPNPKLLLQQLQVCGRHYNCQLSTTLLSLPSPDVPFLHWPTENNQLLGPLKRYWAEILGIRSISLNLIFEPVLVNPIGSSNWHT